MNIFFRIVKRAAELMNGATEYDPYVQEIHHRQKVYSPSGTALSLARILIDGIDRKKKILAEPPEGKISPEMLHVSSTRAGLFAGTHIVGFDSEADLIELVSGTLVSSLRTVVEFDPDSGLDPEILAELS